MLNLVEAYVRITKRPLFYWILRGHRPLQFLLLVIILASLFFKVFPLEMQKRIINEAIHLRDEQLLFLYCGLYIGAVTLAGVLKYIINSLQTIIGQQDELKSFLFNLQGLEFIYEKQLFPELEYIFKHALIQEVAYSSLLQKRRKEIHEEIGKAIEEIYADHLEEFYEMLGHHYAKAENIEKAVHYLLLSVEKAQKNHAHSDALDISKQIINWA